MTEPRVWVASLGTSLDGPGWTEIGQAHDGLTVIDDEPPVTLLAANGPCWTITLTCPSPRFGWWRFWREMLGETHPRSSMVKRAYHQRRR